MPYIKQEFRKNYDDLIDQTVEELGARGLFAAGDINYVISRIIWKIYSTQRSYAMANELIGVLSCIQAEFYRRRVAVYEDEKWKENGDIKL